MVLQLDADAIVHRQPKGSLYARTVQPGVQRLDTRNEAISVGDTFVSVVSCLVLPLSVLNPIFDAWTRHVCWLSPEF